MVGHDHPFVQSVPTFVTMENCVFDEKANLRMT